MVDYQALMKKVDIINVVSSYIPLTKKGNSYTGICPFHDDHSPSLSINPDKGIWKCFSCGVGGNAVKFVQMYENITYQEALQKVAELSGVTIEKTEHASSRDVAIGKLYQTVSDYAMLQLLSRQDIMKYLNERGISEDAVRKFHIGYIDSKQQFIDFLIKKGYDKERLVSADIIQHEDYCRWIGRILFPIEKNYRIKGFTARKYGDTAGDAKYVNSTDSEYFHKSQLFYNYDSAAVEARKKGEIILMEGVGDVIPSDQINIKNCIATLGTSLTKEHIIQLKKLGVTVKLCYDGDSAGIRAMEKAYSFLKQANIKTAFTLLPEGRDPGELITQSPDLFLERINDTDTYFDFLLKTAPKMSDYQSKEAFVLRFLDQLREDPLAADFYLPKLSEITGFSLEALKSKNALVQKPVKKFISNRAKNHTKQPYVKVTFHEKEKINYQSEVKCNFDRLTHEEKVIAYDENKILDRIGVLQKYMNQKGRMFSALITCGKEKENIDLKAHGIANEAVSVFASTNSIPKENIRYLAFLHKDTKFPHIHLEIWQESPILNQYVLSSKLVEDLEKVVRKALLSDSVNAEIEQAPKINI